MINKCFMCRSEDVHPDGKLFRCNDCDCLFGTHKAKFRLSDENYNLIIEKWKEYKSSHKGVITEDDRWEFCFDMEYDFGGQSSQTYGDSYGWSPYIEDELIMAIINRIDRENES